MLTAYDSTDINTVPDDAQYLMGYDSGHWQTYFQMVARFPKLAKSKRIKSIAVQADNDGDVLDCEAGDATPDEVAAWVERQLARGVKRPGVYSSVSEWPAIFAALARAGIHRSEILVWTAHYNGQRHICSAACNNFGFTDVADATQWTSTALRRNLDESVCQVWFFNVKGKSNPHYGWYDTNIGLDGKVWDSRAIVEAYDKLRDRPLSRIIPNRPKLKVLRAQCLELAQRAAREAIYEDDKKIRRPHPIWNERHLGFKYQGFIHRSQGRRVA